MNIESIRKQLQASVIAVPPLARDLLGKVCPRENERLIKYLAERGVVNFLYGGNAVFYHIALSEYARTLEILQHSMRPGTVVVPSVGPSYGLMMDQAAVLKDFDFSTVMILPQREIADASGIATGIRKFVERYGKPIVLYLKFDQWLDAESVSKLVDDGAVQWIKYAVVRQNPHEDTYLREILQRVPADIVVSGIGEQPAIIHMREFGVASFTSGCICVNPRLSNRMLELCLEKEWGLAESIRQKYAELEGLRNEISPIRVLHRAVSLSGIAETGPMQPLLGELKDADVMRIEAAARKLLALVE